MAFLDRDGVQLFVEEAGSGEPPLLLVHGWTCDHTYLAPQFAYFRQTHRVVAVDLRGHGQSDKPQHPYTMETFADDLVWICDRLGIRTPVVIGHSMGGVIAVALAVTAPDLPAAVVALDSPLVPSQTLLATVAPVRQGLWGPHYRAVQRQFVSDFLFLPTDDPQRKAQIVEAMSASPQHVMASAFEHVLSFDTAAAVAQCAVPLLVLFAAQPLSDVVRLRELNPRAVIGQTVGAGHFHQLEVPEQVNAMIERFLAVSLPR
ncbi:MAG: alpha/beta hydrolase [Candidatus Binatia bacterium]|nr:alpha/beta hydrolase [Candidatus Binatia bacterium]